jgi:hypothetical protein
MSSSSGSFVTDIWFKAKQATDFARPSCYCLAFYKKDNQNKIGKVYCLEYTDILRGVFHAT